MADPYAREPVPSGLIKLRTSAGDIQIELWPKEAPQACRNFVQLCLEGYYDNCIFHRIVPGFIAQTGDPTGTGTGGDCIYDEGMFADEFSARLKFTRRGLVAMANAGMRNTNASQFFFTLDRTDELQNKNTIFGSVVGDTIYNVLKIGDSEVVNHKPVYPPTIKTTEVIDNPFPDIVPRITSEQRKVQLKARKEAKTERDKQKLHSKHQKLVKNKGLLSFAGDDEENVEEEGSTKRKFVSAHDADNTGRLSSTVIDDRPSLATIPDFVANGGAASGSGQKDIKIHHALANAVKKRKEIEEENHSEGELDMSAPSKPAKTSKQPKEAPPLSEAGKVKAEIAKLSADLRKRDDSPEHDEKSVRRAAKLAKKAAGAALLAEDREKYKSKGKTTLHSTTNSKKRTVAGEDELSEKLSAFRKKVRSTVLEPESNVVDEKVDGYAGEVDETQDGVLGDKDGDDDGWMSHTLKFRKDATLDIHKVDEYRVVDPLAEKKWTLDELAARQKSRPDDSAAPRGTHSQRDQRGGADYQSRDRGSRPHRDRGGHRQHDDRPSRDQGPRRR